MTDSRFQQSQASGSFLLLGGLIVIVCVWASTIFFIPAASSFIADRSVECKVAKASKTEEERKRNLPACQDVLSQYGATGDLFGAMTSLFSALGFFAVAATVHIEAKARRGQLKPFVVAKVRPPGISLQDPDLEAVNSISLTVPLSVKNVGEPALNVQIKASMRTSSGIMDICDTSLEMPLLKDLDSEEVTLTNVISGDIFKSVLGALTVQDLPRPINNAEVPLVIILSLTCMNLAGVIWTTKTEYMVSTLNPTDRDRIVALTSATNDRREKWDNYRSLALSSTTVKDSWSYGEQQVATRASWPSIRRNLKKLRLGISFG